MILRTLFSICFAVVASTLMADEAKLPVLKIAFPDAIKSDMDYSNGTMQLTDEEGNVVSLNAKFRTRGATAKEYLMKPALNMKLRNEDYTEECDSSLLNMRSCSSWILDAMAIDRICMRNRVGFDVWNEFSKLPYDTDFEGRNGTVGRFIELYINEKYYGIYCLTDRINRKLLNLKKVKENADKTVTIRGVLYKSGSQDILDQNSPCYSDDYKACVVQWHNCWELTDPEDYACEAAWTPLQEALLKGNNVDYVSKYFFMEQLAEYQVFIMALGIADNWGNKNHYFSIRNMTKDINDPDPTESARRKFVVTPWDLDTDLGGHYKGNYYDGTYSESVTPENFVKNGGHYPFSVLQGNAEYKSLLKNAWVKGRTGALSVASVCKRMDDYCTLFENSGAWKRMTDCFNAQKYKPLYVQDITKEVPLVEEWYKAQFARMDNYFRTTGIEDIVNANAAEDDAYYTLQGIKVNNPVNGIFIHKGKKMVK